MEGLATQLYMGNPQGCIAAGESMTGLEEAGLRAERDVFVYRAFLAQNRAQVVLSEIAEDTEVTALRAVRLMARDLSGEDVAEELRAAMQGPEGKNRTMLLAAALVHERAGRTEEAMRAAMEGKSDPELRSLAVMLYASLFRWDEAERELKTLLKSHEDHPLAPLAAARLALARGGDARCREALGALEELQEKHGATSLTLTLQGQLCLALNRPDEAEPALKEALLRDPNSVTALYALHLLSLRLGRLQPAARFLAQARSAPAAAATLAFLDLAETEFDAVAAK